MLIGESVRDREIIGIKEIIKIGKNHSPESQSLPTPSSSDVFLEDSLI
jgi:hypothetical protein